MVSGSATPGGTARYAARFAAAQAAGHFRELNSLRLSSIGLGTYLGAADERTDRDYEVAIRAALERGVNVFDSASNYRHQRSERALGRALAAAWADGAAARDEVFVSTKAGFLPFDGEPPDDPRAYFEAEFLAPGLLEAEEVAAGCHALAPAFLEHQLEQSRRNLGLETIDLFYLHNPETQLADRSRAELSARLGRAFAWLEERARAGAINAYGVATWKAFRVAPAAADHVSLEALVDLAIAAAPDGRPHFRAIQLPLSLAMPEALAAPTQSLDDVVVPALVAARKLNVSVFASASILQGRLTRDLPESIGEAFPGLESDAQRALQFTRSAPGLTSALVGMSAAEHVEENLALSAVPPAEAVVYRRIL